MNKVFCVLVILTLLVALQVDWQGIKKYVHSKITEYIQLPPKITETQHMIESCMGGYKTYFNLNGDLVTCKKEVMQRAEREHMINQCIEGGKHYFNLEGELADCDKDAVHGARAFRQMN